MYIGGIWGRATSPVGGRADFAAGSLRLCWGHFVTTHEDERRFVATQGQAFDCPFTGAAIDPHRLESAYGLFFYVVYEKLTDTVSLGTDRFGYFPLYYALQNERFIFGSSLEFVKNQLERREPDYEAWEELMVLGDVIGEKTTVKQIKRLQEGTRINIKTNGIEFHRFWRPEVPDPVDESKYVRENNVLLEEAMSLTVGQSRAKAVLLSGGEDSRRIALAAARQDLAADFYTQESIYKGRYRVHVDRDVRLAARVAALLGRPHHIEPMPHIDQHLSNSKLRDTRLGFECIAHEWLLPLARRISPESLIYDGVVGDITINGHYFKEFPAAVEKYRDVDGLAAMICVKPQHPWLDEFRRRGETTLIERVRLLLASYPDSHHRLTYYFVLNHARRKTALVSQLFGMYGHWTCHPFLYYPLFIQSLSSDPRLQLEKFYQRECMAALAPEILSVPTTREKLWEEWLISRGSENASQEAYLLRHLRVSDAALELFPEFRSRYRIVRALSSVSGKLLRRFGWFILPLARFSAFLEWLERDDRASDGAR